ncbi:hypothetical protein NRF20_41105 [Streptomyces sp. R-74717]|uniref:hypothetical protein n=1 Tax=Streptomyces sp. R-74717 TaxID=2969820 RepID=UPI0039B5A065
MRPGATGWDYQYHLSTAPGTEPAGVVPGAAEGGLPRVRAAVHAPLRLLPGAG